MIRYQNRSIEGNGFRLNPNKIKIICLTGREGYKLRVFAFSKYLQRFKNINLIVYSLLFLNILIIGFFGFITGSCENKLTPHESISMTDTDSLTVGLTHP